MKSRELIALTWKQQEILIFLMTKGLKMTMVDGSTPLITTDYFAGGNVH